MNKDQFLNSGLLEQYVLGLTSPEENRIVEQHAQAFPEVAEELRQLKQAMDAYVSEHIVPSPAKEVVEQGVFSNLDTSVRNTVFSWSLLFAIIFAGTTFYLYQLHRADQNRVTQLEAEFAALQKYYDHDHRHEAEQLTLRKEIEDPRTTSTVLRSSGETSSLLLYHHNAATQKHWLEITRFPQADEARHHQIWARTSDGDTLLAPITINERRLIPLPYLENVTNIMVTASDQALTVLTGEEHILFSTDL